MRLWVVRGDIVGALTGDKRQDEYIWVMGRDIVFTEKYYLKIYCYIHY